MFKEFILYSLDDMIFLILICTAYIQKNEMIMTSRVFLCAKVSLSYSKDSKSRDVSAPMEAVFFF